MSRWKAEDTKVQRRRAFWAVCAVKQSASLLQSFPARLSHTVTREAAMTHVASFILRSVLLFCYAVLWGIQRVSRVTPPLDCVLCPSARHGGPAPHVASSSFQLSWYRSIETHIEYFLLSKKSPMLHHYKNETTALASSSNQYEAAKTMNWLVPTIGAVAAPQTSRFSSCVLWY